jgi:hypothetical protein
MTWPRGLHWLALAMLLGTSCDKTLSFDPPGTGEGGEPGSGGSSASAGSGGHTGGSDEPWQRAGGPGTNPPSTGGTGFGTDEECEAFCANVQQRCDQTDRRCVECFKNDDCPGGLFCKRGLNRCVRCVDHDDCPHEKRCDDLSNQCVEPCLTSDHPDDDCHEATQTCDDRRNACVTCRADGDCLGSAGGPYCLQSGARCAECEADFHCRKEVPRCDPVLFRCVECADSRDCPLTMVCDPESHTCFDWRFGVTPFPT